MLLLKTRLDAANTHNPDFEMQFARISRVIFDILGKLHSLYSERIDRVLAVGDWAIEGEDLRNLPYFGEVLLHIVLHSTELPFDLYWEISEQVFTESADEDVPVHFTLGTTSEWETVLARARTEKRENELGIPLLISR